MTSAHRPTWNPVKGGQDQGGNRSVVPTRQYSSKDLPSHTQIKYREPPSFSSEDYKNQLLQQELTLQKYPSEESSSEEEEPSDYSEEDLDEEELMAEFEKVKQERAQAENLKKLEEEAKKQELRNEQLLKGNPLIDAAPGFDLKRKWTEETVFKNQARGEPQPKKRFINDTVRNDFHKKFLDRYVH